MKGITGMSWPLADELEAHGYEGEPTVFGLLHDLHKEYSNIRIYGSKHGWQVQVCLTPKEYVSAVAPELDIALANLWIKLNLSS